MKLIRLSFTNDVSFRYLGVYNSCKFHLAYRVPSEVWICTISFLWMYLELDRIT